MVAVLGLFTGVSVYPPVTTHEETARPGLPARRLAGFAALASAHADYEDEVVADSPDVVSALAEILVRGCVGRSVPGDGELARTLARALQNDADAVDLFAVGAVGAWAGFGPDGQFDDDTITRVVDLCRGLLRGELPVEARALVCAALGLAAARGTTNQPGVDFVNVATSARAVEQHELALWAAQRAL
ncbi:MAG: hypothetical protein ACRDNF_14800, partial [Streptosporangiaceae bacterium]